ncbi:MAG: ParB/RepB/Spo0J family partition protein [Dermatophilaceae bacterium]
MSELRHVEVDRCVALRRNPQFLSPHAMESLKSSISRDGFLAPVLLRPMGNDYEVVSGNHRVMAARELGMTTVPAIIEDLDDRQSKRVAVNLNTVHGDPTAELMAPFLAEMDDETLLSVHLSDDLLDEVKRLDEELSARLESMDVPEGWDNASPQGATPNCKCPSCGRMHVRKDEADQ